MPIDQNFNNMPKDRRHSKTAGLRSVGDFPSIGMTFLRCGIAGFYGFRMKNAVFITHLNKDINY